MARFADAAVTAFLQQDAGAMAKRLEESQDSFFGGTLWWLVGLPLVALFLLAWVNKKPKQTVREYSADDFDADVLGSAVPVLVHFYRDWNIGDQLMISQVERLAVKAAGQFKVGFIDADRSPSVLERYPQTRPPVLILFVAGVRAFQCEGVFDEADVMIGVQDAIRRHAGHAPEPAPLAERPAPT